MKYKNLLLIDDDEDDQDIFLTALANVSSDINCIFINSAHVALQKLINKELQPDIIFLDLNMPIMNGQQFLVEIKKIEVLKDIPVIIFSTSSHLITIQITKDLGAFDFITKPNKFDDLVSILRAVL